jgi:RNA polymerase sigma factor (sigma-70 family)
MKIKIFDSETNNIKETEIEYVIQRHKNFLYKLCNSWIRSFWFDQSLEIEDLIQELRIKLLNSLSNYDYQKGNITPYMGKICKNFFINKRSKMIRNNLHPTTHEGKPIIIKSLSEPLLYNENITLGETIKDETDNEFDIELFELVKEVKDKLNMIRYKPRGYRYNGRTFVRLIFDTIYEQDEKFTKAVLFDYRCRGRYSQYDQSRRSPASVIPTANMLGCYFKADIRAINYAYRVIRKTINECS